jgi:hypothetical protein
MILVKSLVVLFLLLLLAQGYNHFFQKKEGFLGGVPPLTPQLGVNPVEDDNPLELGGHPPWDTSVGGEGGNPPGDPLAELMELSRQASAINKNLMDNI